jgi:hypothetical protein
MSDPLRVDRSWCSKDNLHNQFRKSDAPRAIDRNHDELVWPWCFSAAWSSPVTVTLSMDHGTVPDNSVFGRSGKIADSLRNLLSAGACFLLVFGIRDSMGILFGNPNLRKTSTGSPSPSTTKWRKSGYPVKTVVLQGAISSLRVYETSSFVDIGNSKRLCVMLPRCLFHAPEVSVCCA